MAGRNIETSTYGGELYVEYDKKYLGTHFPVFHCHNVYEIYLLEQGVRNIVIEDMIYQTSDGDAAMIYPNRLHRSFGDTPYSGICINFNDRYLDKYFSAKAKHALLSCFQQPIIRLSAEELEELKKIITKIKTQQTNHFVLLAYIFDLLLTAALTSRAEQNTMPISSVNPIIEYIGNHFKEIRGLDDIADALHMNKNYLCGLFKRNTGMTISLFMNTLRVQYACTLLAESNDTIDAIGRSCGFQSTSYFCRIFKRLLDYTPSEFRKREQAEDSHYIRIM